MCALNEAGRIQRAIGDFQLASRDRPENWQLIIVDNGSTDGTREFLASLDRPGIEVVLNERNIGKGGSIKKGIALSRGRYVAIHDPDMEYAGRDVWKLFDATEVGNPGLVLGSRVVGGHAAYQYRNNYLGVRALSTLINFLYRSHITDAATAMKLIDGDLARRIVLRSDGFDLDFELVVRILRLGYPVTERRVEYKPRTIAEGKKLRAYRDGTLALRVILRDRFLPKSGFDRHASNGKTPVR